MTTGLDGTFTLVSLRTGGDVDKNITIRATNLEFRPTTLTLPGEEDALNILLTLVPDDFVMVTPTIQLLLLKK